LSKQPGETTQRKLRAGRAGLNDYRLRLKAICAIAVYAAGLVPPMVE
jgi:hypothetical protein